MVRNKPDNAFVHPDHTHTFRLTFAYERDNVHLLSSQLVNMKTPAAVAPPPTKTSIGQWLEVRDAKGKLLYHQVLHDPLRKRIEVYSDDPRQPSVRSVERSDPRGEFTVLVPDLPDASTFTLYNNSPEPVAGRRAKASTPQTLVKLSFSKLRG